MSFSLSEYIKIDVGWCFATDPTGELTAGFKGTASRHEGNEGEGREKLGGEGREGRGKGEWGRVVKRGKLGE